MKVKVASWKKVQQFLWCNNIWWANEAVWVLNSNRIQRNRECFQQILIVLDHCTFYTQTEDDAKHGSCRVEPLWFWLMESEFDEKRPKKCWSTRAAGQSESTETLAEGCWGQRLVPVTLCWGDMIVWAQTVGTSAPKPVQRDLQITRGSTGQQAVQGTETGPEDANKHEEKKNGQTEKML